jgi:hypothetical protein
LTAHPSKLTVCQDTESRFTVQLIKDIGLEIPIRNDGKGFDRKSKEK